MFTDIQLRNRIAELEEQNAELQTELDAAYTAFEEIENCIAFAVSDKSPTAPAAIEATPMQTKRTPSHVKRMFDLIFKHSVTPCDSVTK